MKFKNDNFKHVRGGTSRYYDLLCSNCNYHVAFYQKDGVGFLKRLYLDRLTIENYDDNLTCTNCKELLGIKFVYKLEKRMAYRLIQGKIGKKLISS